MIRKFSLVSLALFLLTSCDAEMHSDSVSAAKNDQSAFTGNELFKLDCSVQVKTGDKNTLLRRQSAPFSYGELFRTQVTVEIPVSKYNFVGSITALGGDGSFIPLTLCTDFQEADPVFGKVCQGGIYVGDQIRSLALPLRSYGSKAQARYECLLLLVDK